MAEKNHMEKNTRDITFPNQRIDEVNLEKEMERAYIDYAMSVIVGRALPDVRDGMKPVHRRILYTMYEGGMTSDKKHSKSVATVGDVLKKYHPHGDQSVYDALVRLAQSFSMRYPLVDGKGNFGSIDGDPPAAYRYTEARLAKISNELVKDIDKDTVEWTLNFDETLKEPVVVPTRFPNLLVNGSQGIAVGMTTNIPPHNLTEVINGVICVLENPEAELDDIMEHIKGPDFPTSGIIVGRSGIRQAYSTGRGHIRVRGRTEMEEFGSGRVRIVVTELPYMVNKARLVETIADQYKEKRLEGISGLRDESDRNGMRIVIELKKDANPQVVLNRLYAQTALQSTFAVVMLALVENQTQPKILTLREVLDEYIAFQKEVITRRTRFELRKAEERMHLVQGLLVATDNIDEVIRTIRAAYDDAREQLMAKFSLSEVQAQAILEMQLRRLQGLEREKLEKEYAELEGKIKHYHAVLESEELVKSILKEEILEIREKYGDERRTEIGFAEDDLDVEDLIEEEECVFTLTKAGYLKRMAVSVYKAQNRGGRGVSAASLKEEDVVETLFTASTHDYILFFTSAGKVHRKKGYQIPESSRAAKGTNIVNVIPVEQGERVTAMLHIREFDEEGRLFMITKNGTVKRVRLDAVHTKRKAGIRCITLDEDDELIAVLPTDGNQNVILATHNGLAICFNEGDVRVMGRDALGVRGIRLKRGDYVVGADLATPGLTLLSVTENGYGKRTRVEEYTRGDDDAAPQRRGGSGLKNYNITEKTGKIAAARVVTEEQDVLLITNEGVIIRMAAADVNTYSRSTKGTILMRLAEGVQVISATVADPEEPEDEAEAEAALSEAESAGAEGEADPAEAEAAPETEGADAETAGITEDAEASDESEV